MRLLVILFASGLSACAIVQRHSGSGYSESGYVADDSSDDSEQVKTLTPEERERYEERMMLTRQERSLRTSAERSQYEKYKETLESDRERIEFLSLDGTTARERYLQSKGYASSPSRYARDVASLIEQSDIALGMGPQAVRESWGDPVDVEFAGRPGKGNERWRYVEYVSTPEGYQEEQRVLYFENGKLVGWEKY